jgi:Family of unknown function (DUF6184)
MFVMRDHPNRSRASQVLGSLALGILLVMGCGGSSGPLTQPQARDQAADAVCDFQARCGEIGVAPATYADRDACLTTSKGNIQGWWPPADCTKIVQAEFDTCIAAVKNEACGNGLDFLNTLTKCGKATVCAAP